jgi:hypothetical protein
MIDVEATFGEVAKNEWNRALREWIKFGEYEYEAFNDPKHQMVRLDDSTNPERYNKLHETQQYWTTRWADQMNYRYWKDRCQAEMTNDGVHARQLFYEGTVAYKKSDFETAVSKFKEGLDVWKVLLADHKDYRNDDFNKKDTGLIVKRYVRALRQLGEPEPKDLPFRELLAAAEADTTVDPFDANEMIGPTGTSGQPPSRPQSRPAAPPNSGGLSPLLSPTGQPNAVSPPTPKAP